VDLLGRYSNPDIASRLERILAGQNDTRPSDRSGSIVSRSANKPRFDWRMRSATTSVSTRRAFGTGFAKHKYVSDRGLDGRRDQKTWRHSLSGTEGRHLSRRVPAELLGRLEELAAQRNETISQTARRLLADGVDRIDDPDRAAIDTAIAPLEKLRRSHDSSAAW